jgi:hypothetical protein
MSSAEFGRRLVDGAWLYEDADTQAAAMAWAIRGFNLAALDNYLDEPGWGSPAAQANRALLVQRRAQALEAQRVGQHELAFASINYLQAVMQLRDHRDALLPIARKGRDYGAKQSAAASKPRGPKADDGSSVHDALRRMVQAPENCDLTVKQLWRKVFAVLDSLHLDPVEHENPARPSAPYYIYTTGAGDRRLAMTTFANLVSQARAPGD